MIRLAALQSVSGVALSPGSKHFGALPMSRGFRTHQVSVRDSVSHCTSARFNLTNVVAEE